jgi:Mlc titration factor MtfA (ptsG expression regulator)
MFTNLEFFGIGHGKGEVDGVGTLLKREIWKEQIKPRGRKIQNDIEVVAFLKSKTNKYDATHPNVQQHINKFFHEVKVGDMIGTKALSVKP